MSFWLFLSSWLSAFTLPIETKLLRHEMRLCAVASQLVAFLSQFQSNGVSAAVGVTISFNLSCWEIFSLAMTLIKEESLTYKWARNDLWKLASTKEFDVWKKKISSAWTFFKASKLRHNSLEWCLFTLDTKWPLWISNSNKRSARKPKLPQIPSDTYDLTKMVMRYEIPFTIFRKKGKKSRC